MEDKRFFSKIKYNISTLFRLFKTYAKLDLLWFLRDTKYCLLYIFSDCICSVANMFTLLLLATQFEGFGGMTHDEMLFMMSYSVIVDGVYMMFFMSNNIGEISRIIGRGQLDHRVTQPVPLWIQLMTEGFLPFSGNITIILGIGMMVYSIDKLSLDVSLWWTIKLIFYILGSTAIIMSMLYIVSSKAFYTPVESEESAGYVLEFTRVKVYPLGIYSKLWQTVFCTVLPVGLATWLPSTLLLNIPNDVPFTQYHGFFAAVLAICMTLAAVLFRRGMKHYATNGSPRYSGFGHH